MNVITTLPFIVLIHFVCPLIFFTNFTRNPYQTQITLLHLSIVLIFILGLISYIRASKSAFFLEALPWRVLSPLLLFTLTALISTAWSYHSHPDFFKPSILAEGLKSHLFWLLNVLGAFWIGLSVGQSLYLGRASSEKTTSLWRLDTPLWISLLAFAAGWILFDQFRAPSPVSSRDSLFAFLWDPFGACLWLAMYGWLYWRLRIKGIPIIFNFNLMVGALASLYGVAQYFGWDVIWTRAMSPYGARAISTFGNPNFLSPYLVLLIAISMAGLAQSKRLGELFAWGTLCFIYEAGLLATLTRSSWAGAIFSCLAVAALALKGTKAKRSICARYVVLGMLGLTLFFIWPVGLKGQTQQSPLNRLIETSKIFDSPQNNKTSYQPSFQRYLIWSSAWEFLRDRPFLGKGWGTLELFFPFYQGRLLYQERFRPLRTHANNGHNELIEIWTQTGILGMGLALWFFAVMFVWPIRNLRILEHEDLRFMAVAILAGLAGFLVDNILNVSLHFAVPGYLFWWQAGVLLALYPKPADIANKATKAKEAKEATGVERRVFFSKPKNLASLSLLSRLSLFLPTRDSRLATRDASYVSRFTSHGARFILAPLLAVALFFVGVRLVKHWMAEFYYFRGFVLHQENNLNLALERLNQSWKLYPAEVNRNYELGNVYARVANTDRAIWAYTEAIRANAGYDEIYFNRGILRAGRKENELAIKDLLTSILINPLNHHVYQGLLNIFMADPRSYAQQAQGILEAATYYFPKDKDFLNNFGSFLVSSRGPQEAARYFLRAIEVDPHFATAQRNLGFIIQSLAQSGQKEQAKEILSRWRSITPLSPQPSDFNIH